MRFHMGFSFNLWKLKKYIIPFLIGILGFLGLSMFSCITVYALEDENIEEVDPVDYESLYYYSLDQQTDDTVHLSGLSDNVYWFQQPQTSNDVLVNIYVILFLYVIGYFTIKFITIIHNTKWESRL